jgi:uncharacterized protein YggE
LNQQFDYTEGRQVFRGFEANNTVTAKLRDLKKLPQFLDALASDGATNFNGPSFSVDDDSKLKETARDKAWDSSMKRANAIARKAGYASARVLRVEEQSGRLWRISNASHGGARTILGQGYAHCTGAGAHWFDDEFHV